MTEEQMAKDVFDWQASMDALRDELIGFCRPLEAAERIRLEEKLRKNIDAAEWEGLRIMVKFNIEIGKGNQPKEHVCLWERFSLIKKRACMYAEAHKASAAGMEAIRLEALHLKTREANSQ